MTAGLTTRRPASSAVWFGLAVLGAYAAVGLGAGWVWHELWQPAQGVVSQQEWYTDGDGLRQEFSGTGLYVLVAAASGLVLGAVFAFAGSAQPVATVLLCLVGSMLAAWLMLSLGEWLGPTDPQMLAKTAEDGTRLRSALRVSGLPPLLSFPLGSLVALAAVYTLVPGKTREHHLDGEPRR